MNKVILGLDVSTSRIGICIIDYGSNLLRSEFIKMNSKDDLEDRCIVLENFLSNINAHNSINNRGYFIDKVFIESPFMMFSGGKTTAMTMAKLQRFNGMVCYMVRRSLGITPVSIAANKARGLVGLKVKRGEDTKKKVIEWVQNEYPTDFEVTMTRFGNPKPGTDDMADAVVVARAGLLLEGK
jgi:Holliday junction resolvasome RuvABC endonuclease subunit